MTVCDGRERGPARRGLPAWFRADPRRWDTDAAPKGHDGERQAVRVDRRRDPDRGVHSLGRPAVAGLSYTEDHAGSRVLIDCVRFTFGLTSLGVRTDRAVVHH